MPTGLMRGLLSSRTSTEIRLIPDTDLSSTGRDDESRLLTIAILTSRLILRIRSRKPQQARSSASMVLIELQTLPQGIDRVLDLSLHAITFGEVEPSVGQFRIEQQCPLQLRAGIEQTVFAKRGDPTSHRRQRSVLVGQLVFAACEVGLAKTVVHRFDMH